MILALENEIKSIVAARYCAATVAVGVCPPFRSLAGLSRAVAVGVRPLFARFAGRGAVAIGVGPLFALLAGRRAVAVTVAVGVGVQVAVPAGVQTAKAAMQPTFLVGGEGSHLLQQLG